MNMNLYLFEIDKHWNWFKDRAPTVLTEDLGGFIVIDDDTGTPQAAYVLSDWTATSCVLSVVVNNPLALRHGIMEVAADFVFNVSDRLKIIARVSSGNKKSLKFTRSAGFVELFRIKDGFDIGEDIILFELTKENCRFLKKLKEVA